MSGTSLDGLDIAFCHFEFKNKRWRYSIKAAETFKYTAEWKNKLAKAHFLSGEKLIELHAAYGKFIGEQCNKFIAKKKTGKPDLIASHGHTIFHQPEKKFTFQLGDGNAIHAATNLPVAFDFRGLDIALGGEGAPLVPIGDQLLFSDYDICLNLGGIANLSMQAKGKRIAFDVCFCNMALNYLVNQVGKDFDDGGKLASGGALNQSLLTRFEKVYTLNRKNKPSLAREGFEKGFQPLLDNDLASIADKLRTVIESIVIEISQAIPKSKKKVKMLATGGGALNDFLIQRMKEKLDNRIQVVVPDKTTIDFKEALVFAFLGVLRLRGQKNTLKSVTGASSDSSSGILLGSI